MTPLSLPPLSKMMGPEAAFDHLGLHITAQAQLQPDAPLAAPPLDSLLDSRTQTDDVPEPIRLPPKQHPELLLRPRHLGLGKVHRHTEPLGLGLTEHIREYSNGAARVRRRALRRVAAEVDADDHGALATQEGGDAENLVRLGQCVAAVDAEDEARAHARGAAAWRGGRRLLGFPCLDGGHDGADVDFLGHLGCAARRGAELEVEDAVCGEVVEDGARGARQGGGVGEEAVDV